LGEIAAGILQRDHLLTIAAKPTQRQCTVLSLTTTNHRNDWHFLNRMLANLVVNLLIAKIGLDAQSGLAQSSRCFLSVLVRCVCDRRNDNLHR